MAKDSRDPKNKRAAKAAKLRREKRLLEMNPLFHGNPPYEGYREWVMPDPVTGTFILTSTAPFDTRLWFERVRSLLVPIYKGRVPVAATYLDEQIQEGAILVADSDDLTAGARRVPIAVFAEAAGDDEGPHAEVCPRLNCAGGEHVLAEHKVWTHLHHLHAAGYLLLNDHNVVRRAMPPSRPGEGWRFPAPEW
ncbi:hypothetical protein [Streptomyces millisiae]|uniref:Uncharacterized protein n=1 Tax=Streptomyces millisiae TaxID=3075542 RepID=A0ABU2LV23_9ACTN|nr:hypothetical protein [Streptomyces sp. DSM 44918]MDT0321439.1 hypothetical protein [Streptomyces sp. DSM 44918]